MKKKFLLLPCIAAVAIATFVGTTPFDSNVGGSNNLLLANVEALSENEGSPNSVKCGTRETYESGFVCPGHPHLVGFKGTIYSYSAIGYSEKYKEGRKGADYSCPDLHQPACPIDDVREYSCPAK